MNVQNQLDDVFDFGFYTVRRYNYRTYLNFHEFKESLYTQTVLDAGVQVL